MQIPSSLFLLQGKGWTGNQAGIRCLQKQSLAKLLLWAQPFGSGISLKFGKELLFLISIHAGTCGSSWESLPQLENLGSAKWDYSPWIFHSNILKRLQPACLAQFSDAQPLRVSLLACDALPHDPETREYMRLLTQKRDKISSHQANSWCFQTLFHLCVHDPEPMAGSCGSRWICRWAMGGTPLFPMSWLVWGYLCVSSSFSLLLSAISSTMYITWASRCLTAISCKAPSPPKRTFVEEAKKASSIVCYSHRSPIPLVCLSSVHVG